MFRNIQDGDSRTVEPSAISGGMSWPHFIPSLAPWFTGAAVSNFARGGKSLTDIDSEYGTSIHPLAPGVNDLCFLSIWGGINDALLLGMDGEEIYAKLVSIASKAKDDKFKLILFTDAGGNSLTATQLGYMQDFNQRILFGDLEYHALIRPDVLGANFFDPAHYVDATHPTEMLALMVAAQWDARVNRKPEYVVPRLGVNRFPDHVFALAAHYGEYAIQHITDPARGGDSWLYFSADNDAHKVKIHDNSSNTDKVLMP